MAVLHSPMKLCKFALSSVLHVYISIYIICLMGTTFGPINMIPGNNYYYLH